MTPQDQLVVLAQLKQRVIQYPKPLTDAQASLRAAIRALDTIEDALLDEEARIASSVNLEIVEGTQDKPRFANEKARKDETRARAAKDPQYQAAAAKVAQAEQYRHDAQTAANLAEETAKAIQLLTVLTNAEVNLMVAIANSTFTPSTTPGR